MIQYASHGDSIITMLHVFLRGPFLDLSTYFLVIIITCHIQLRTKQFREFVIGQFPVERRKTKPKLRQASRDRFWIYFLIGRVVRDFLANGVAK